MKIVVLTGAGVSADSGIPTYRSSDGLWANYKIEEVCTPEALERDREKVINFYNMRRREMAGKVPNAGHKALAELEKYFDVEIITQNIDNLHELAGSTKITHLHGELTKLREESGEKYITEIGLRDQELDETAPNGELMRPHIVFFGEAVPMIETAIDYCEKADIFLIIGTSLNVYPAAGLLNYVPADVPVYLIDPKHVPIVSGRKVHVIQKGASAGMEELIQLLTE